jgi:hypothetical protein
MTRSKRRTRNCQNAPLIGLSIIGNRYSRLLGILLADLKQVFTDELIFSKDLIELLAQLKERLWPEVCRGKPITERWVARQLHSFKIVASNIRIGAEHKVGFTLA